MSDFWNDFWGFVWLFFWGFALVAYLFAIFSVLADLFRDRALNGWLKALWILFLVFLPFLTVLVYVIARGRGMVERMEYRGSRGPVAEDYAWPAAPDAPATEITRAKQLLDQGVITAGEFDALKSRALGNRY